MTDYVNVDLVERIAILTLKNPPSGEAAQYWCQTLSQSIYEATRNLGAEAIVLAFAEPQDWNSANWSGIAGIAKGLMPAQASACRAWSAFRKRLR